MFRATRLVRNRQAASCVQASELSKLRLGSFARRQHLGIQASAQNADIRLL